MRCVGFPVTPPHRRLPPPRHPRRRGLPDVHATTFITCLRPPIPDPVQDQKFETRVLYYSEVRGTHLSVTNFGKMEVRWMWLHPRGLSVEAFAMSIVRPSRVLKFDVKERKIEDWKVYDQMLAVC